LEANESRGSLMALPIEKTLGFLADLIAQHVFLDAVPKTMRRRWNLSGFTVTDDAVNERLNISIGVGTLTTASNVALYLEYDASAVVGDAFGIDINETLPPSGQSVGLRFRQAATTVFELIADASSYAELNSPTQMELQIADIPSVRLTAGKFTLVTDDAHFGSDVVAPKFYQETHATTPQTMLMHAMDVTTGTGSDLDLRPGAGSVAEGSLHLKDGNATNRLTVGPTGDITISSNSTCVIKGSTGQVDIGSFGLRFASTVLAPSIFQATHATAPQTMLMHAMDVTTGTGSDLKFRSGSGSVDGGDLSMNRGGTTSTFYHDATKLTLGGTGAAASRPDELSYDSVNGHWFRTNNTTKMLVDASEVNLRVSSLVFNATVVAPKFYQQTHATTPQTMLMHAMDVTTGTGSDLDIRPGAGSVADGQLSLQDGDGNDRVTVDSLKNINLLGSTSVLINVSGYRAEFAATELRMDADLTFVAGMVAPVIAQEIHATTPQTMLMHAGDVTTGTGSDLDIRPGAGSVADGQLSFQDGAGNDRVYIEANGNVAISPATSLGIRIGASGEINTSSDDSYTPTEYKYLVGAQTTDATITNLKVFATTTGRAYNFRATVAMKSTSDGDAGGFTIEGVAENTGGTVAIIGTNNAIKAEAEDAGWGTGLGAAVVVTASGANLLLRVEGQASDTVNWSGKLEIIESSTS
jgi:hypothetical protein